MDPSLQAGGTGFPGDPMGSLAEAVARAQTTGAEVWVVGEVTTDGEEIPAGVSVESIAITGDQPVTIRGGYEPCDWRLSATRITVLLRGLDTSPLFAISGGDVRLSNVHLTHLATSAEPAAVVEVGALDGALAPSLALSNVTLTALPPIGGGDRVGVSVPDKKSANVTIEGTQMELNTSGAARGVDFGGDGSLWVRGSNIVVSGDSPTGITVRSGVTQPITLRSNVIVANSSGNDGLGIGVAGATRVTLGNTVIDVSSDTATSLKGIEMASGTLSAFNNYIAITGDPSASGAGVALNYNGLGEESWLIGNIIIGPMLGVTIDGDSGAFLHLLNNAISATNGAVSTFSGTPVVTDIALNAPWEGQRTSSGNMTAACPLSEPGYELFTGTTCNNASIDPNEALNLNPPVTTDRVGKVRGPKWDIGPDEGDSL